VLKKLHLAGGGTAEVRENRGSHFLLRGENFQYVRGRTLDPGGEYTRLKRISRKKVEGL